MTKIRINEPNYTQTPNIFFEHAREMKEAEIRITLHIIRQTFGWHKTHDRISLSQFEKATGLTRQGVINGITAAIARGTVQRKRTGDSFTYSALVHKADHPQSTKLTRVVNEAGQSKPPGSQQSRPRGSQRSRHTKEILKKEEEKNNSKQSKIPAVAAVDEQILKKLDLLEIDEPVRSELACLPHVKTHYLNEWIKYSEAHTAVGAGFFVNRIRRNDKPPEQRGRKNWWSKEFDQFVNR